jgi:hypothetical protein
MRGVGRFLILLGNQRAREDRPTAADGTLGFVHENTVHSIDRLCAAQAVVHLL